MSAGDQNEVILMRFMQDLETFGPNIIAKYKENYPDLAKQFEDLVIAGVQFKEAQPDNADPPPGRLGDYVLSKRPPAKGGMGFVYEAKDEHVERQVAVKIIRPDKLSAQTN